MFFSLITTNIINIIRLELSYMPASQTKKKFELFVGFALQYTSEIIIFES